MTTLSATPTATPETATPDQSTLPINEDGDHDRFAHYVVKADLDASKASGMPVRALCGKLWTPDRDPSRYPVCPTCKDIAARWSNRGAN